MAIKHSDIAPVVLPAEVSWKTRIMFKNLLILQKRPRLLMAAMEFGTLEFGDQVVSAKVGGLGSVIQDMVNDLPDFLKKYNGKVAFVFPGYKGVPTQEKVASLLIRVGERNEKVDIYETKHPRGASIYIVDHPIFRQRSILDKNRNLYVNAPSGSFFSGRAEWEDAFFYSLFNQTISQIYHLLDFNIYHAHDYHTGLAAIYMGTKANVTITIHNAGPGYQGVYRTKNYGQYRDYSNPKYPFGTPFGDYKSNDQLLKIFNIDFDTYMKYFEQDGAFNMLKVINYIGEHNLISGTPVSEGYASELESMQKEIESSLQKQPGRKSGSISSALLSSGDVKLSMLVGVPNGLSRNLHASNHRFLKTKTEDELEGIHRAIKNLTVRRQWTKGLNYGQDLESPEGIKQVHDTKLKLKQMLQRTVNFRIVPNKPLFSLVTRLVDQKNVQVLVNNIPHLVEMGAQVIIAGQPGDVIGKKISKQLMRLEEQYPEQVKFFNMFVDAELGVLIQAGADFTVITSKFEPCGLTDIEAAWLGTIVVARRTGGLGKVQNGFYYEWNNPLDSQGESFKLKQLLTEVVDFYRQKQTEFQQMRIQAMKEDFAWDAAFEKYYIHYNVSAVYKMMKSLELDTKANPHIQNEIIHVFIELMRLQKQTIVNATVKLLQKRSSLSKLEKKVVEYFSNRKINPMDC